MNVRSLLHAKDVTVPIRPWQSSLRTANTYVLTALRESMSSGRCFVPLTTQKILKDGINRESEYHAMGKRVIMYNPSQYNTVEWFESLKWQHQWIEKMAGWWVGEYGLPKTVIDFGAGDGWWLKAFHDMGSNVGAIELHEIAREYIPPQVQTFIHDLTAPIFFDRKYDLVICLEVAEHLPKEAADVLVETIAFHTKNLLLFSAAGLGQPGEGHINLQPQTYWRKKIKSQGKMRFSPPRTEKAIEAFGNITNELFEFLPRNLQVFAKV